MEETYLYPVVVLLFDFRELMQQTFVLWSNHLEKERKGKEGQCQGQMVESPRYNKGKTVLGGSDSGMC